MTPKEKAMELVDKMLTAYDIEPIAIKCALIAVDEMMLVLPFTDINTSLGKYCIKEIAYLKQVKQELENL